MKKIPIFVNYQGKEIVVGNIFPNGTFVKKVEQKDKLIVLDAYGLDVKYMKDVMLRCKTIRLHEKDGSLYEIDINTFKAKAITRSIGKFGERMYCPLKYWNMLDNKCSNPKPPNYLHTKNNKFDTSLSQLNYNITDVALKYLAFGWSIIPLYNTCSNGNCTCRSGGNCNTPGKHPLINTWKEFQQRRPTANEIMRWWEKWPEANIGIVTGTISGLFVLDIDIRHGGIETMKNLHLPPTLIVKTGNGGWHYYYKIDAAEKLKSVSNTTTGIDAKGEGGYVIAPPSNLGDGRFYEWLNL